MIRVLLILFLISTILLQDRWFAYTLLRLSEVICQELGSSSVVEAGFESKSNDFWEHWILQLILKGWRKRNSDWAELQESRDSVGPGITSDPGQVVSGSSHSSVYLQCVYKCSVITFYLFCDEKKKKWFYIFFISVLEKQNIRNSTLVFDDCFLPLKYLRFEKIIGNLFVVTFSESTLFFVRLFFLH